MRKICYTSGQLEKWRSNIQEEGAITAADQASDHRAEIESNDSGFGITTDPTFYGEFRSQNVVGSPGCNSSDAPELKNPSTTTSYVSDEDKNSKSASSNNKRSMSEDSSEGPSSKRPKTEDNLSPLDFVIKKQTSEMPDIFESDGGD